MAQPRPARRCAELLLLFLFSFAPLADAADIKGTVANAEGAEPLGKIQLSLLGTSFATTSASDGSFQISQIPPGNYLLQANGVGYRALSVPFQLTSAEDTKTFQLTLTPATLSRTDSVEVHADVFDSAEWPTVGELTLTSTELQQTSTVIANDPLRSVQALPGVSASANNDLFAQFSVMGAPFEEVGLYVDDVLVPNLLHTVSNVPDAATLSLFTGNDVEEIRLLPVAYPVRYGDQTGAALVIRTRTGSAGPPLVHGSLGLADSELLAEGGFGPAHKGTWLIDARKSYIGYLERAFAGSPFSQDGFYDADVKLTYDLTPTQSFSLLATGGRVSINDPSLSGVASQGVIKSAKSNLAIARLGWRWNPKPNLLIDSRAAYVPTDLVERDPALQTIVRSRTTEWSGGTNVSWNWRRGAILQGGYTVRRPAFSAASGSVGLPAIFPSFHGSHVNHDLYLQNSAQFWRGRLRLQGGIRWGKQDPVRVHPLTGQASVAVALAHNTQVEGAWGRYAEFLSGIGEEIFVSLNATPVAFRFLPRVSWQYIFAVEQRFGERVRFRAEVFDRQNEQRGDFFLFPSLAPLERSALSSRDYSRGLQFMLQRRSENRLSGWISYTFVHAERRFYQSELGSPIGPFGFDSPYLPTFDDQRHTANIFASYRLAPSIRVSAKALYGSGFPVESSPGLPVLRIGPYERLDLRADKSWSFKKWRLGLYTEILNVTKHYNPRFDGLSLNPVTGQTLLLTSPGVPILPTVGLTFDF
jgi:hypothetical protein